jgi:hypothetical protein
MLAPTPNYRTAVISCAASANQALPEPAEAVLSAYFLNGNASAGSPITGQALSIVTSAPVAGQLQFLGTPAVPSSTVTLAAAAVAGELLVVQYVPRGSLLAAA